MKPKAIKSGTEENWYALCLSIVKGYYPEKAFYAMEKSFLRYRGQHIIEDDIKEMVRLKNKMTYEEISELFGLNKKATISKVKRFLRDKPC